VDAILQATRAVAKMLCTGCAITAWMGWGRTDCQSVPPPREPGSCRSDTRFSFGAASRGCYLQPQCRVDRPRWQPGSGVLHVASLVSVSLNRRGDHGGLARAVV